MLGSLGFTRNWQWAVCGKHPSAADYFSLGHKVPMLAAFADWIEKGYRTVAAKRESMGAMLSWRFWIRGSKKDSLSCGILRDSTDSIGRPYPLMILGTGVLQDWEREWDHVLWACEKTWSSMEGISTRRYRDLSLLADEVSRLRSPDPDWPEFRKINQELARLRQSPLRSGGSSHLVESIRSIEDRVVDLVGKSSILVSMNESPALDRLAALHLWQGLFKLHLKDPPNLVFMGGSSMRTYLAIFRKAIAIQDFVDLWTVS
jgi:type VI secretion system protein VasJ